MKYLIVFDRKLQRTPCKKNC